MWDPTARPAEQTRVLKTSGGQASVVLRPWTAREHLEYENRMATFFEDVTSENPQVLMGTMRLHAACLTVQRIEGLPDGFTVTYEQDVKGKGGKIIRQQVTQLFNPKVPDHLLELGPEVYGEIVTLALEVQPLPGDYRPEDDGKGGTTYAPREDYSEFMEDDADGEGEQGEDPSQTPPTPPTETLWHDGRPVILP